MFSLFTMTAIFLNTNILFLELEDSVLSDPSGPTSSLKPAHLQPTMTFLSSFHPIPSTEREHPGSGLWWQRLTLTADSPAFTLDRLFTVTALMSSSVQPFLPTGHWHYEDPKVIAKCFHSAGFFLSALLVSCTALC